MGAEDDVDERRQRHLSWYVATLAVPAGVGLVVAVVGLGPAPGIADDWPRTAFLLAVAVALGWFSAAMKTFDGHVTLLSVAVLAAYPLVGPWGAVIVSVAPLLDIANHFSGLQRLFNAAVSVLPTLVGVGVWDLVGVPVGAIDARTFPKAVLACLATDLVRFVVNALLFAPLTVLLSGQRLPVVLHQIRRDVQRSVLPAHLGYGPLGVLLALLWVAGLGPLAALLVLAPLVSAHIVFDRSTQEEDAREETLRTLIQAVETKDPYTRGHSERVSRGVELLGSAIGVTGSRMATLRFAGLLHDVGKLGVPTRVLTKKGSLTAEEYGAIKAHPLQGFDIVMGIDFLDDARTAILHHHERLDGAGYPAGLSGSAIPEFSRMIAVVDAFDSMTSSRSYHRPRSVDDALTELRRCAGTHFDPGFVDVFCATVSRRGWRVTAGATGTAVAVGVPGGTGDDTDPDLGADLEAGVDPDLHLDAARGRVAMDPDGEIVAAGRPALPFDHDDPTVDVPDVHARSR